MSAPLYERCCVSLVPVIRHPLAHSTTHFKPKEEEEEEAPSFIDPLGAASDGVLLLEESAPTSNELKNTLESNAIPFDDINIPAFPSWRKWKDSILQRLATTRKISSKPRGAEMVVRNKVEHRLAIIEDLSGLKRMSDLSQEELVRHANQLREMLISAWNENRRVDAIALVTEVSRLLNGGDACFYPCLWVVVTDILDVFASLVFRRLLSKANEERMSTGLPPLPNSFTSQQVPDGALLTAKNWFIKITEIQEYIPRLYVEMALIPCMRFVDSNIGSNAIRLVDGCSRITHPVCAAYARAYACKAAMAADPNDRAPHWKALNDWMQNYTAQPTHLVQPALSWIMHCVVWKSMNREDIAPLWEYASQPDKRPLLLLPFLECLAPSYLSSLAFDAASIVVTEPAAAELRALGQCLLVSPCDQHTMARVTRMCWRSISRISNDRELLEAAIPWLELIGRHFTLHEVDVACGYLSGHLTSPLASTLSSSVSSLLDGLCASVPIPSLFSLDSFVSLYGRITDDEVLRVLSESVLQKFVAKCKPSTIDDFSFAYQLLDVSGHVESDILICRALDRIVLEGEAYLEWLVAARASLGSRQRVVEHVIELASALSLRVPSRGMLLRAVIAFMHITIPSVDEAESRFRLTLRCLTSSVVAHSAPQMEAMLHMLLSEFSEVSAPTFIPEFLSLLLLVPNGHLFFVKVLSNLMSSKWRADVNVLSSCLRYLLAASQKEYPCHFAHVAANDVLYDGDDSYQNAMSDSLSVLVDHIVSVSISPPQLSSMFDSLSDSFRSSFLLHQLAHSLRKNGVQCAQL